MSVQRCKNETTSTEFVNWQVIREKRINGFHREDYFWANIAKILTQANVKDSKSITLDQFLLKFTTSKPDPKELTEVEKEAKIKRSKAFWSAALGVGIDQEKTK